MQNKQLPGKLLLILSFLALFFIACESRERLKRDQYFAEGYQQYASNCANCHQDNGKGMGDLYPDITRSRLLKQPELLACLIKNGSKFPAGIMEQNHRPMPGAVRLTNLEIAEIITYARVKWAADTTYTSIETVEAALLNCPK